MPQWYNSLTPRVVFWFFLHDTGSKIKTLMPRRISWCHIYVYLVINSHLHLWFYWPRTSPLLFSSAPSIFDNKRQDPTGLTALLQSTDLVGVVHTLYCILLHSFVPESASQSQEPYGPGVIQVALQGIRFLNSFALLDLSAFQVFLTNPEYFLPSHFANQSPLNIQQILHLYGPASDVYLSMFSVLYIHYYTTRIL